MNMQNVEFQQIYDDIFNDDKLNIKSNVVDFAHLIEQDTYNANSTSKVYSISAEFGCGKTFFCEKLQQVLARDKVKVGKLNIWEMDFYENPLIPILSELNRLYSKKGKNLPSKIINVVTDIGIKATSVVGEASAKIGCAYAINQIAQATGCGSIKDVDLWNICKEKFSSETIYDDYNEYQNALKELKSSLCKWASKQKEKPIVIIIDELDRCKPDYAVKTLEVLKHFFDVPGFVFVLAVDEEQLKNSVQTLFGTTNYEGYKRKFISNSFHLPEPDKLVFTEYLYTKSNIDSYIEKIQKDKRELVFKVSIYNSFLCTLSYSEYGNANKQETAKNFNKTQTSETIIKKYFAAYSECFGFSLRKMEQVFDRLSLFIKYISASAELFSPDLATFLVCLHEADIDIFNYTKNIKGSNIHVIDHLFGKNTSSYIYKIYKEQAFKNFKVFNRTLAPMVLQMVTYSITKDNGNINVFIQDNLDRFYNDSSDRWLYQRDAIDTHDVLMFNNNFNKEQFKENYCRHIDFIAHFE